jgi:GxxExxY protein
MKINPLSTMIIGAAIEVHKALGPGLLESSYEEGLCWEFSQQQIPFERQKPLPITYKGHSLNCGYRLDILVDNQIILEIKAVEAIEPVHKAQLLTYLKLSRYPMGLLLNFNVPLLRDGIVRLVNNFNEQNIL